MNSGFPGKRGITISIKTITIVLSLMCVVATSWADSDQKEPEVQTHKDGVPVILVGLQHFPDIKLTLDERRRIEDGGIVQRIYAVSNPAKAPGHPCAGLHCSPSQVCMAYDMEDGNRISFCAEPQAGDAKQKN